MTTVFTEEAMTRPLFDESMAGLSDPMSGQNRMAFCSML